jgi:CubicO group peptidase (beta-lactamase class C family)
MVLATFRKRNPAAVEVESKTESSQVSGTNGKKNLAWTRLYGLFWVFLGGAVLNGSFTPDMAVFIVPGLALFFVACGVWSLLSTFGKKSRPGEAMEAAGEATADTSSKPEDPIGQRRVIGVLTVALGFVTLWYSGLSIGLAPAAISPLSEGDNELAGIVTQAVARDFESHGHVGMMVGAVAEGEEVLLGFGRRSLSASEPPDADTVFEIGSISKVFTGILLAQKVENGEVSLEDRVADLLPEGWTLSEEARGVTLRHLTTHSSGFPRLPSNLLGFTAVFKNLFGGDPYRNYSVEAFREALATVELEFEPGSEDLYSNFGVGLLGFALATRDGTDYETLLKTELCEPLGLERTVTTNEEWHREHFAEGYRAAFEVGRVMPAMGSEQWWLPNHLAGAGGIRSTGGDMMRFLKANMGILSTSLDSAIRLSHQEIYGKHPWSAMGMNWIRSLENDISQNILWHNGGTGGYRSYLGFTEDRRFGVVVLSNTGLSVDELGVRILKTLVREYTHVKPVTAEGYAKVAPFTGVRWEGDRPIIQVEGEWRRLISIDGIPIDRIMEFSQETYREKARKRFSEDLVELLSKMGHDPDWEVELEWENSDGKVESARVEMTEENRARVRG